MTDAQLQQLQALLDVLRAAWETIVQIAREILSAIGRWWRVLATPLTMMRKKIRRYQRLIR